MRIPSAALLLGLAAADVVRARVVPAPVTVGPLPSMHDRAEFDTDQVSGREDRGEGPDAVRRCYKYAAGGLKMLTS